MVKRKIKAIAAAVKTEPVAHTSSKTCVLRINNDLPISSAFHKHESISHCCPKPQMDVDFKVLRKPSIINVEEKSLRSSCTDVNFLTKRRVDVL